MERQRKAHPHPWEESAAKKLKLPYVIELPAFLAEDPRLAGFQGLSHLKKSSAE